MNEPEIESILDYWQEHKDRLRAYLTKRVPQVDWVDDILQEVFIRAQENLHTLKSKGSISAWLYRIANNAMVDHFRAQKPTIELPAEWEADVDEPSVIMELASCLQPLIDKLPDTYRTALMLAEIQGLPQKKVAEQLGLTISAAKSRIQRGRKELRKSLFRCCEFEMGRHGLVDYKPRAQDCAANCK